jgi:D-specific alpha-keto acid dehydrogenase
MICSETPGAPADLPRARVPIGAHLGMTIYGCEPDEAALFRELAPGFGVVPTIAAEPLSEANIQLSRGNRCISVGHKAQLTSSVLRALGRSGVFYISTRSIGSDHIDVDFARSLGICVETVAYSPDSVADYTVMLILMAVRNAKSVLKSAEAQDFRLADIRGKELRDLTVGVVGTGRIGVAVVDRLRGFGCRVLAHDTRSGIAAEYLPLDELLQRSDVVTLHTPLNPRTHHLLDRRRIEQLKPGSFVINTGRGSLLDTEALFQALESGRVGGAALDVLEGEEGIFYADCRNRSLQGTLLMRLQQLPNVIITPHTAYYTEHALRDTVKNSIINCQTFERGALHA